MANSRAPNESDLTALFARLGSSNNTARSQSQQFPQSPYHQPSVSSPVFSPGPAGPQPRHGSAILSPNISMANSPAPAASDHATGLLSLLNVGSRSTFSPPQASPSAIARPANAALQNPHNSAQPASRTSSAADLVATFQKKPTSSTALHTPPIASNASGKAEPSLSSSAENPQAMLLRLLKHSQPSTSHDATTPERSDVRQSPSSITRSSIASLRDVQKESDYATDPIASLATGSPAPQNSRGQAPSAAIFSYANPFEQLERSSPLNRTPKPHHSQQASLQSNNNEQDNLAPTMSGPLLSSMLNKEPETLSPGLARGTISDAISEVAEQVEREVDQVLAHAEQIASHAPAPALPPLAAVSAPAMTAATEARPKNTAKEGQGNSQTLKDIVEDTTGNEGVADSWESAEAEEAAAETTSRKIHVYDFPMKPFTSVDVVKLGDYTPTFRSSIIMEIAKHKKEFDQMDRQLVSASKNFIVYATLKPLGFRIIRQESGAYRAVFSKSKERVFNVSMCSAGSTSAANESDTVLGTGVNGSIFWTSIPLSGEQIVDDDDLEQAGFVFPAAPAHDDNTSGGQLKTRAKTSTRHPEFFAVGRGKSIHLVWPQVARSPEYTDIKTRICDSEKYLKEKSLKIATGKAGKDFAFSADDTVIVSLDKAGRIRFWDIRPLIDGILEAPIGPIDPITVRTPIFDLQTTSSSDRSWPTSVFFFDKDRPMTKGIALRYLIVGQKQNHTLQLWDLGLGKAVQELNLPHDNESDAICTVTYHAKTGVLVVGHPTRNSIYLIHISSPKYNLSPAMNQAKYLNLLADPKSNLPQPGSTAIMSGIREYSLGIKGQLRSLHLLDEHNSTNESYSAGNAPIFELYVVHSKGVSLLSVHREDMGWEDDFRCSHPVDAVKTGAVTVSSLRPPQSVADSSTNGDSKPAASVQGTSRDGTKRDSTTASRAVSQTPEAAMRASTLAKVESKQDAERAVIINGGEKSEKKKKKRSADLASQVSATGSRAAQSLAPLSPSPSYAQAAGRSSSPAVHPAASVPPTTRSTPLTRQDKPEKSSIITAIDTNTLETLTGKIIADVSKSLDESFTALYKQIDDDKRVLDASGAAKQEAILRLVSSTLSDNLDKAFARHIKDAITSTILPSLSASVQNTLGQHTGKALQQATKEAVTHEIRTTLPGVIGTSLREPDTLRIISDLVAGKVAKDLDSQLKKSFQNIMPSITSAVLTSYQQSSAPINQHITEHFRQTTAQRQSENAKIDQLTKLVHNLTETVQAMHATQSDLHEEIQSLQQQLVDQVQPQAQIQDKENDNLNASEPEDPEFAKIRQSMESGNHEAGTIGWLQSSRQAELFDNYFVRFNPNFVQRLSPLVTLSVAAATTASMTTFLPERLAWLEAVLGATNPTDPEIREVVPQIMDVISARLSAAFMSVAEHEGHETPVLQKMQVLAHKIQQFKQFSQEAVERRAHG